MTISLHYPRWLFVSVRVTFRHRSTTFRTPTRTEHVSRRTHGYNPPDVDETCGRGLCRSLTYGFREDDGYRALCTRLGGRGADLKIGRVLRRAASEGEMKTTNVTTSRTINRVDSCPYATIIDVLFARRVSSDPDRCFSPVNFDL